MNLYETLATTSSLKLLLGEDIGYSFPLKYPKTTDLKKAKLRHPATLAKIIKDTPQLRKQSFDKRFDGKHPIELAVENLQYKGLTKGVIYKILKNKASVKTKLIKGTNAYLANFITDDHKAEIIAKLKEVTLDRYGNFIRNGSVF